MRRLSTQLLTILPLWFALAACSSPAISTSLPLTATTAVTLTTTDAVAANDTRLQVISPRNMRDLKLLDCWGLGQVQDFDISPDGKTVAVAATTGVYLYDIATGKSEALIATDKEKSPKGAVPFSPDGQRLAIATDDIYIWNLADSTAALRSGA